MVNLAKFEFFNNFSAAVLVVDLSGKIVFRNFQFTKTFGNIKNLERFANYFNFDICLLDTDNIQKANPISFALSSAENFFATSVYQRTKELFQYFEISSFFYDENKVIILNDITAINNYNELSKRYENLKNDYGKILEENKDFSNFQQKAQNQAIKMALMHRVSNVIRESINI